jgi:hypothetical protein
MINRWKDPQWRQGVSLGLPSDNPHDAVVEARQQMIKLLDK